jgi:hypothetical protein
VATIKVSGIFLNNLTFSNMTPKEREALNKGSVQSASDPRKYTNSNGDSHKTIGVNRTEVEGKIYFGYSDAKKAMDKR